MIESYQMVPDAHHPHSSTTVLNAPVMLMACLCDDGGLTKANAQVSVDQSVGLSKPLELITGLPFIAYLRIKL